MHWSSSCIINGPLSVSAICHNPPQKVPRHYSGDTSESEFNSVVSGSSSLPEVSDSEDDPSLPLPPDFHARDIRICQGPRLLKYKVTVH